MWVYDPNSPLNDDVTIRVDISRTDQTLFDVRSNINVGHSPICFFTQSYEQREPLVLTTSHSDCRLGAVAREGEHMDLFWVGPDGAVGSTWWDSNPGAGWGDHPSFPITPPNAAALNSGVAVVSRTTEHLDVFYVGPDGAIGSTWWDLALGMSWGDHAPFSITSPGAARADSPIAAIARGPNHLDVFWIGPDGAIASTWWDAAPGMNWGSHQPFPITPPNAAGPGSGITVVSRTSDQLDVFWIGPDGAIGSTWWNAGAGLGWGDHQPFAITQPNAARRGSPVSVVARAGNHMDVFWIGHDGGIGSTWWDAAPGMSWADHQPFPIAPAAAAGPSSGLVAIGRKDDHLDVFWIGPDGAIGSTWWNAGTGLGWGDHQPFAITPPHAAGDGARLACIARQREHMDVFWVGPDGAIGSTWWHDGPGTNWGDHQPFAVTSPGAARLLTTSHSDCRLGAVAREGEHMDLFWVGPDGAVGSTWWDSNPGAGWGDHPSFPITPPNAAALNSGVAVVSRTTEHLDVFYVGPDGAIGSTWWDLALGMSWGDHAPFSITSPGAARADSPIAAIARGPNHLDVFWIGPDGAIASTWWDAAPGMNWGSHQPFPITPPNAAGPGSGITVVSRTSDQLDVFWIGPDGAIGSTWWNAGAGLGWGDHQPFAITQPNAARRGSPVSVVARAGNHMDVFWIGHDGGIGSTWWDAAPGMSWADHQPFPIAPAAAAGPSSGLVAIGRKDDHLDVFWIGPDGAIGSTWWNAGTGLGWGDHQPFAITPPHAAGDGARLACIARQREHMDVFWVGPDGAIGSTWWHDGPGTNWGDHQPFAVTSPGAAR
ncbi:hypothetical protein [Nitrosospira lacus]|uniref:hypothetical protein n=1 Tax=Nitrosospira lacus TaxID=1288494 RepID=UPI00125FBBD4|nr:hypothetical protein [Nitrosospira lacus]